MTVPTDKSSLGAIGRIRPPGVYADAPVPSARAPEVRMDVAAFVGLTERGPVFEAARLESWQDFVAAFGRPGTGRQVPEAVFQFFRNGGTRCVVVRSTHVALDQARSAVLRLPFLRAFGGGPTVRVMARDPGPWGDELFVRVVVRKVPIGPLWPLGGGRYRVGRSIGAGTTLVGTAVVADLIEPRLAHVESASEGEEGREILIAGALPPIAPTGAVLGVHELLLDVEVRGPGLTESFVGLTLSDLHADYALERLRRSSRLVRPVEPMPAHVELTLDLHDGLPPVGVTRSEDVLLPGIERRDTMDRDTLLRGQPWVPPPVPELADSIPDPEAWRERDVWQALTAWDAAHEAEPVALLAAPDLVHPYDAPTATWEELPTPPTTEFEVCAPPVPPTMADRGAVWPLLLPPTDADGYQVVAGFQSRLVDWCSHVGCGLALLDVPPDLDADRVRRWRRLVRAPRAAANAPYLRAAPASDPVGDLRSIPPCGAVAGVISARTRSRGVAIPPANEIVQGVAGLRVDGPPLDRLFLHQERINVVERQAGVATLIGARTTSDDPTATWMHVRRILDYLARQLPLDLRWAVFEPNDRALWLRITLAVERRMLALLAGGAFAVDTPENAFFVRCDGETNPADALERGEVTTWVGFLPVAAVEYVVFRLVQTRDGANVQEGA